MIIEITVVISFVLALWIINEFEKLIWIILYFMSPRSPSSSSTSILHTYIHTFIEAAFSATILQLQLQLHNNLIRLKLY